MRRIPMSKGSGIRFPRKMGTSTQAAQYSVWSQQQKTGTKEPPPASDYLLINGDNLLLNGDQVINTII